MVRRETAIIASGTRRRRVGSSRESHRWNWGRFSIFSLVLDLSCLSYNEPLVHRPKQEQRFSKIPKIFLLKTALCTCRPAMTAERVEEARVATTRQRLPEMPPATATTPEARNTTEKAVGRWSEPAMYTGLCRRATWKHVMVLYGVV